MSFDLPIAIRVSGVSKSFQTFPRPLARLRSLLSRKHEAVDASSNAFVALDDVSFVVERGKAFGIMGQNGSGKSTLLQIIAGVMAPSSGSVQVNGKVAALLELGSGFNPDFTGIENIYLNASVMGLSKAEIDGKLDAIVSFADIGMHIDLPVKTYSSGMMMRLAFAVQVVIAPEILIIDEALAVGDAKFQLKCFRRLDELKASGTTILFVSHATELVKSFCSSVLVLQNGKPIFIGDAKVGTIKYYETLFPDQLEGTASQPAAEKPSELLSCGDTGTSMVVMPDLVTNIFGVGGASLTALRIEGIERPNILVGGQSVTVLADFRWEKSVVRNLVDNEGYRPDITLGIAISNVQGTYLFGCNGFDSGLKIDCLDTDNARLRFVFDMPRLAEGEYFISVAIALGEQARHVQLKWYDCFATIRCMTRDKHVYGLFSIDYSLERIQNTPHE